MASTDADRLAAAGKPVTIAGHDFHVRFTARSFKLLEDEFGSIMKVGEALSGIQSGESPLFGPVFSILSMGLRHETVDGHPVTEDWLLDNADPRFVSDYATAAFEAIGEALPAAPETPGNAPGTNGARKRPGASRGATSSTSPSPDFTVALVSSGTR